MHKKQFIALADAIRETKPVEPSYEFRQWIKMRDRIADFCQLQNSAFNRSRWITYINGGCGPNGGAVKDHLLKPADLVEDGDEYWENGKWQPCVAEDFDEPVFNSGYEKVRRPNGGAR